MRKQQFILMLGLGVLGSAALLPNPITTPVAMAQAQTISVKGQVVDQDGEPLMGATIKVKDSANGTVTDLDGFFELNIPSQSVLVVSYVGFLPREIAVRGRADLGTIQLDSDNQLLEQVVVVGYGTQKKADLTGSVSVVNADEMKKVSHSNISSMLEGKVAGVQITSDGEPGANPSVRIRGIGSFGDTSPLYVVDGVPMGTSIRDFSPNDIETIQVLKDASAGAIYGSRAANGVVIITTKNGQKDQPVKVDYKGYFGVDRVSGDVYDVMDADQYSAYLGISCQNSKTPIPGGYKLNPETGKYQFMDNTNTDWFKEVFKTGIRQNHNINFSGGGAHNTYNIGLDYYNQKGTVEGAGPNYERYTARINNTMDVKFIKFRTSIVYSHSDQDGLGISNQNEYIQGVYGSVSNVLSGSLFMPPTIKAYDESTWVLDDKVGAASAYKYDAYGYGVYYDNIHGDISASNPLLINNLVERNTIVDRFVGSASADVDLFDMVKFESKNHKLNYKLNLSYSKTHVAGKVWTPAWIQSNRLYLDKANESLNKSAATYSDALIENTITYDGTIGKHHVNVVAGQTYEEEGYSNLAGKGVEFTEPYFLQLQNSKTTTSNSYESKHALASFIGRVNYDYDGKYLLSAVVRRDGSSRLTKDIRWETFPSVSLGWRFDKEEWFPFSHDVINMFKVRGSYGVLGNENINEYRFQATMNRNNLVYSYGNSVVYGSAVSTFVNEKIAWEKKKSTNVGIDLALFNNQLEFTAEWYKNVSEDLLYDVPVPENAGVDNAAVTMNAASMENSGLEFSATYRNHKHPLKYDISANVSTIKNKVTSLGFGTTRHIAGGNYVTYVGQEIGKFYGYVYEGIARTQADLDNHVNDKGAVIVQNGASVGDCLYKDIDNNGIIDADDQVVLGSGLPKMNFGLSAYLAYNGFDLSISTYGALGYHVADYLYNALNSCYGYNNKDVSLLSANRWSEDGLTYLSDKPRTYIVSNGEAWNDYFSDRMIQNASYWKIANVELGYNFPDTWFHGYVNGVRLYVSAQNLHTFTNYKGYNVDYAGGTFTPGFNYCSFPTAKSFMAGILFSF